MKMLERHWEKLYVWMCQWNSVDSREVSTFILYLTVNKQE